MIEKASAPTAPHAPGTLPRFTRLTGEFADAQQEAAYRLHVVESERTTARWTLIVLGVLFALEFIADAFTFSPGPSLTVLAIARFSALPLAVLCWLAIRHTASPERVELTMAAFWVAAALLYTVTAYPYAEIDLDYDQVVYPLMALCALLIVPGRLVTAVAVATAIAAIQVGFQLDLQRPGMDVVGALVLSVTVTIIGALFSVTLRKLRRQQHAHATLLESSNRALLMRTSELEERLIQSQQMESTGRLASVVAHESNNAFSVIVGISDLMLQSGVEEPLREQLETVNEAAMHAAELTRELLKFSRQEPFQPSPVRLATFLNSMRPMLEASLPKGTSLELTVDEAWDPHVMADPAQLRHALLNLAINAGQAMQTRGSFAIRAREASASDASACKLNGGTYVAIEAQDNGSGMAEETLEKIFEPFFTTKGASEGTGLGLSVVDWMIARNQGGITVVSTVGVGTTFTLLLPATDSPPDGAASVR